MSIIARICLKNKEYQLLMILKEYYNTSVSNLLTEYIKWLEEGNIPHGYEDAYNNNNNNNG